MSDFAIYNHDAEQDVLASILVDPSQLYVVEKHIEPSSFYSEKHRWIYEAILAVKKIGLTPSIITVSDYLEQHKQLDEIGGPEELMEMMNSIDSSMYAEDSAKLIARDALRRAIVLAAGRMVQLAHEETDEEKLVSTTSTLVYEATTRKASNDPKPVSEILPVVVQQALTAKQRPRDFLYMGLAGIDKAVGPLLKGNTYIIAARPGIGKSSLALTLARNVARQKFYALYFTMEMEDEELVRRLVSPEANVSALDIFLGNVGDHQEFEKAVARTSTPYLWIDDTSGLTPNKLFQKAQRMQRFVGLDLVIVDYIQLMDDDSLTKDRRATVDKISRQTKTMSKELGIPVINVAQLNREVDKRGDNEPILSDLREAGGLEQDASVVLFLWKDKAIPLEGERHKINWKLAKHRQGRQEARGTVQFIPHLTQFIDELPRPTESEKTDYRQQLLQSCDAMPLTWQHWLTKDDINRYNKAREQVLTDIQAQAMPALLNNQWVVLYAQPEKQKDGTTRGGFGNGKSYMARIMQARLILDHGIPTRIINWRLFTESIKQSWNNKEISEVGIRQQLNTHCVIIDELDLVRTGNGYGQWYIEQLYDLFDVSMALERDGKRRPLVLILHKSPADFATQLAQFYGEQGKSAASRLMNRSGLVGIDFSNVPSWVVEKPQF